MEGDSSIKSLAFLPSKGVEERRERDRAAMFNNVLGINAMDCTVLKLQSVRRCMI